VATRTHVTLCISGPTPLSKAEKNLSFTFIYFSVIDGPNGCVPCLFFNSHLLGGSPQLHRWEKHLDMLLGYPIDRICIFVVWINCMSLINLYYMQYYSMPGGCKFGKSCKYIHCEGKERKTEAENVDLNFLGLPLRLVSPLFHLFNF
jgi:hypothetical protein